MTIPYPVQAKAAEKKEPPVTLQRGTVPSSAPHATEPEETMKGLFGQLLQSMAAAGPDRISIGALTHSAPAAAMTLELEPVDTKPKRRR